MTITGTATDTGGGVVAGVEVSTDGGTTWHPATIMTAPATSVTWTYTVDRRTAARPRRSSPGPIDDSGNIETPGRRHHGQRRLPVLDLGRQRHPGDRRLRRRRARSSSG